MFLSRTTFVFKSLWTRRLFSMTQSAHSINLGSMRVEYRGRDDILKEDMLLKEPIKQFKLWFDEAMSDPRICEPNAMCLATCTSSGKPSARYVLLKGYGQSGFKFFTNYSSSKGREIAENPNAALVFYWEPLRRSIRVEGVVKKLSEQESTEYFYSRPRDSQIGAACSNQSQPISSREILHKREADFKKEYGESQTIPKPSEWGGYVVVPHMIEFWQGQSDRLHDRIRFRIPRNEDVVDDILLHQGENGWVYERLQP